MNLSALIGEERVTKHSPGTVKVVAIPMLPRLEGNVEVGHGVRGCVGEEETGVAFPDDQRRFHVQLLIVSCQCVRVARYAPL